jgi:PIN domain nuclease of toxin-antitoxin system
MLKEHRDFSDRMIISHAITEKLILISSDTHFYKYERFGLDFIYNEKK